MQMPPEGSYRLCTVPARIGRPMGAVVAVMVMRMVMPRGNPVPGVMPVMNVVAFRERMGMPYTWRRNRKREHDPCQQKACRA